MPWPCDTGNANGFDPTEDLIAIVERANAHSQMLVIQTACDCALNHATAPTGINAVNHCRWIQVARNRADANNWMGCYDALRHQGLQGPPAATMPSSTPWPCDSSPTDCDAARTLFRIIERANSHMPANASIVIYKACVCARHPKKKGLTLWNTVGKHCDYVNTAWGRAQVDNWSACIDALDHVGGGGMTDGDDDDDDTRMERIPIEELFREFKRWFRNIHREPPDLPGKKKKGKKKSQN